MIGLIWDDEGDWKCLGMHGNDCGFTMHGNARGVCVCVLELPFAHVKNA